MSRDFSAPQRTEAIDFVAGSYHGRAVYYWESAGLNLAVLHDPATRQCDIDVYVDPDLQGQGYGTRLLLAA